MPTQNPVRKNGVFAYKEIKNRENSAHSDCPPDCHYGQRQSVGPPGKNWVLWIIFDSEIYSCYRNTWFIIQPCKCTFGIKADAACADPRIGKCFLQFGKAIHKACTVLEKNPVISMLWRKLLGWFLQQGLDHDSRPTHIYRHPENKENIFLDNLPLSHLPLPIWLAKAHFVTKLIKTVYRWICAYTLVYIVRARRK